MRDGGCFRPGCGWGIFRPERQEEKKKKQGTGENCIMNSFVICAAFCSVNFVNTLRTGDADLRF